MFGYIRPEAGELKVREFELFKSCYCGLCHSLGREYGLFSRFILNYDFVFLTMLLWDQAIPCKIDRKRCIVHPCRKKCVCVSSAAYGVSAGLSLILAYWKLKDSVKDDGFFKAMLARAGMLFLKGGYKKAARKYPAFNTCVETQINALSALEEAGAKSIDKTADTFANILACIADTAQNEERQRTLKVLFYHIGRWIYIADAVNDLKDDLEDKRYNPIAARFEPEGHALSEADKEAINTTMAHSENISISAFGLLEDGPWLEIIKNILYLGMPEIRRRVLNGTFKNTKEGLPG